MWKGPKAFLPLFCSILLSPSFVIHYYVITYSSLSLSPFTLAVASITGWVRRINSITIKSLYEQEKDYMATVTMYHVSQVYNCILLCYICERVLPTSTYFLILINATRLLLYSTMWHVSKYIHRINLTNMNTTTTTATVVGYFNNELNKVAQSEGKFIIYF